MESGSKYLSAGRVIWGHVTAKHDICQKFVEHIATNGIRMSPRDCDVVIPELRSLGERLKRTNAETLKVAVFLSQHPRVRHVLHPALPSHVSYSVAIEHGICPSVLCFYIDSFPTKSQAEKWMKHFRYIQLATSFGKTDTLLDVWLRWGPVDMYDLAPPPPPAGPSDLTDDKKAENEGCRNQIDDIGKSQSDQSKGMWFRLAIGWGSDTHQILDDLTAALSVLTNKAPRVAQDSEQGDK